MAADHRGCKVYNFNFQHFIEHSVSDTSLAVRSTQEIAHSNNEIYKSAKKPYTRQLQVTCAIISLGH